MVVMIMHLLGEISYKKDLVFDFLFFLFRRSSVQIIFILSILLPSTISKSQLQKFSIFHYFQHKDINNPENVPLNSPWNVTS